MVATRQEVASADGTPIPVWISGEGRPLLVVHGALSNHEAFDLLRAQLEPHVTFAAIDRRGTFLDPRGRHDLERDLEDVAAVAASLGPEVDFFGHSSGAVCCLGAALIAPQLRKLIVYEPPLTTTSRWLAFGERIDEMEAKEDLDGMFASFIGGGTGLPEAAVAGIKSSPMGAEMFRWAQTLPREVSAMTRWTLDPMKYESLEVPTLYVKGSSTPTERQPYLPMLQDVIPHFTHVEIEGQGHMAHVLAPAALASSILKFLEE
jgi:pimeloyl-ACP methyl ester carboxylesterase